MTAFLRTLRGQATLFGVTTLLAILLAVFLAGLTGWFEGHVVQKYTEPTVSVQSRADAIASGSVGLTAEEADDVYAAWMSASDQPDVSGLDEASRARVRRLVVRSMVSGSPEQRARAVALWETVDPGDGLREEARAYAERLGRQDVLDAL